MGKCWVGLPLSSGTQAGTTGRSLGGHCVYRASLHLCGILLPKALRTHGSNPAEVMWLLEAEGVPKTIKDNTNLFCVSLETENHVGKESFRARF